MNIQDISKSGIAGIKAFLIFFKSFFKAEDWYSKYTIVEDIRGTGEIGFVDIVELGDFIQPADNCDLPETGEVEVGTATIQTKRHVINVPLCQDKFTNSFARYQTGATGSGFSNSDFVRWVIGIVQGLFGSSLEKLIWDYGYGSSGRNPNNFIKLIVDGGNKTSIDYPIIPLLGDAEEMVVSMINKQHLDMQLINKSKRVIHLAPNYYKALKKDIIDGCCSNGAYEDKKNGIEELFYDGYRVLERLDWNPQSGANGTYRPNGVLIAQPAFIVGFDSKTPKATFKVFYSDEQEKLFIRKIFYFGTGAINPDAYSVYSRPA